MIHLLVAAALSGAGAKPLFVPPKGMIRVAEDAVTKSALRGAVFVAEYRGVTSIKPSWSSFTYKTPEIITIAMGPATANADELGIQAVGDMTSAERLPMHKIIAEPIAVCGGKRGWLNAFVRRGEVYERLTLSANSNVGQYLMLVQLVDALEYVTPQEEAAKVIEFEEATHKQPRVVANRALRLCNGSEGWFTHTIVTDERGRSYQIEGTYGYGSDTLYALMYMRAARAAEETQARKALYSLCPS